MAKVVVDQDLMDFVVKLAVNNKFRSKYQKTNKAGRRKLMEQANLSAKAIKAVEAQSESRVELMLNKQVAGGGGPK